MANSSTPLLLPALLLLLQNKSYPKTSDPAAGYEVTESPLAPGSSRNHNVPHDELGPGEAAAATTVLGVSWLVSVLGNSLVCLVIHRNRRTQSTTNYFVVSTACADLLISMASMLFMLLQFLYGRWMLGNMMCKLVRYIQYLTLGVQLYVLLSICVDRFYTVVYPFSFKVSREKAKKMILASWLFIAVFVSPAFLFHGSSSDGHCSFFLPASWEGSVYGITLLLEESVISSTLIILFYQKVVTYIWRMGTDGRTVRGSINIIPRRKVKTIKMFLMLNLVFLLSWLPFYMAQLWHPQETDYRKSSLVFLAITCISFGASAAKPILYCAYNPNFRRGMKETCCMSAMKYYRSNIYGTTTCSSMGKKDHVGIADIPAPAKAGTKGSICDAFYREDRKKKLAWAGEATPV